LRLGFRSTDDPLHRVMTGISGIDRGSELGRIGKLLCGGFARKIADAADL
jgi:hypothetical protein